MAIHVYVTPGATIRSFPLFLRMLQVLGDLLPFLIKNGAQWPASCRDRGFCSNLTFLELFPIIVAFELWGDRMSDRAITFWSGNFGAVH